MLVSPSRLRRYPMLAGVGATVAFIGLGCGGSASLGPVRPEASIDSFITSQALVHPSSPKIRLEVDHPHVTFFDVSFGTPFQCDLDHQPVMCQLGYATGLRYGDRIGWVVFDYFAQPDSAVIARAQFFDLRSADTELLALQFEDTLCARDYDLCHYGFPHYLARDAVTPTWRTLELARSLITFIDPQLAVTLLANPTAGSDCDVLRIIASLPVYQGDAYAEVRAAAASRLAGLAACSNAAR